MMCGEACLELVEDPVPRMTVANCLQRIGSNPITHNKSFHISNRTFLLQRQVNYVEYIIVTRYTKNLGVSMKEVMQVI